jgi:ribosomal protein S26
MWASIQDRFKSEVVEKDEYLLSVLRYIHQNPIKAGIVQNLEDFKGSSYIEYVGNKSIIDAEFILDCFSIERKMAISRFEKFMNETIDEFCFIEDYSKKVLTDDEARVLLLKSANIKNPFQLQNMEKVERDKLIRKIKLTNKIPTRQIARLTGVSQSVISRA